MFKQKLSRAPTHCTHIEARRSRIMRAIAIGLTLCLEAYSMDYGDAAVEAAVVHK